MKDPITLNSGAVLTLSLASFGDSTRLLKTVARELKAVNFDMDTVNFSSLSGKDVNVLKNAVLQAVQSDAIELVLKDCMKKCLYNGNRIVVPDTFEGEDARQDYLPVAWEVIKVNLLPFFAGLSLSSLISGSPPSNAPPPAS